MGGSGSRNSGLGGRRTRIEKIDDYSNRCENLNFSADLYSPVPSVVVGLKEGEQLTVHLDGSGPSRAVVVRTKTRETAGTIAGVREMRTLIYCLEEGHAYEASVTATSGPQVTVFVRRAQR